MNTEPEIDPRIDLKSIHLRPEEKLMVAHRITARRPHQPLTALQALQRLAGVEAPEDIGKGGPVKGSCAFPENENVSELRRYEVVFGRDSLITAQFVFDQFPLLTRTTLKRLAELQGIIHEPMGEEEPGKIVHEARPIDDPIAPELMKNWGWKLPYYGTIDATPRFISAAALYLKTQDSAFGQETYIARNGQTHNIMQAARAALAWLTIKLDSNPEGLLESRRSNTIGGLVAQSWKDSPEGHHHADGRLVNFNSYISSVDAQANAYDALYDAATLFPEEAAELLQRARKLQRTVLEHFWIEDSLGGYFALGSERDEQGQLHLLQVRTSNMGHLLNSRFLEEDTIKVKRIKDQLVKTLFSPSLLAKAGIRTLASHENRYRPYSYHNGSVWPWDTSWISFGLLRHGYKKEAEILWDKILQVVAATKCFPELVSGDDDKPLIANRYIRVYDTKYNYEKVIEQPPQEIQAWTVASVIAIQNQQQM